MTSVKRFRNTALRIAAFVAAVGLIAFFASRDGWLPGSGPEDRAVQSPTEASTTPPPDRETTAPTSAAGEEARNESRGHEDAPPENWDGTSLWVRPVLLELQKRVREAGSARAAFALVSDLRRGVARNKEERVRRAYALAFLPSIVAHEPALSGEAVGLLSAALEDEDELSRAYALVAIFGVSEIVTILGKEERYVARFPASLPEPVSWGSSDTVAAPAPLLESFPKSADMIGVARGILVDESTDFRIRLLAAAGLRINAPDTLLGELATMSVGRQWVLFRNRLIETLMEIGTDEAAEILMDAERDELVGDSDMLPYASRALAAMGKWTDAGVDRALQVVRDSTRNPLKQVHEAEYLGSGAAADPAWSRGREVSELITSQVMAPRAYRALCEVLARSGGFHHIPDFKAAAQTNPEGMRLDAARYALESLDPDYSGETSVLGRYLRLMNEWKGSSGLARSRELQQEIDPLYRELRRLEALDAGR